MKVNVNDCTEKMLNISTGHIPEHTAVALGLDQGKAGEPALAQILNYVFWFEYGWILFCDKSAAEMIRAQHAELAALIDRALHEGCSYLKLDADACELDGAPLFDW